jgi:hypothetical protein
MRDIGEDSGRNAGEDTGAAVRAIEDGDDGRDEHHP